MRERLADTLDYVFGEVGPDLGVTRDRSRALVHRIRSSPQSPHTFGAYYDLVFALENDELEVARSFAKQMMAASSIGEASIGAIDDRPPEEQDRYRRLLMTDMDYAVPPSPELMLAYRKRLDDAFKLLDAGFAEMASEIRALLREIVVAAGPEDPNAITFDGASSYMMWGAVLLNARGQKTVLDAAQALAHESGHNLLFGFSASGPLVENPDDELFSSPLRKDPRPMDGVFHATYVVARMHQTLSRLLESGVLDAEQTELAIKDLAAHRKNFEAGDAVVREGARLTHVGRQAIEAARHYMALAA
jgi:HEXXH motif-containing protein